MINDDIWEEHEDEDKSDQIIPNIEDKVDTKGHQINQQPAYYKLIKSEVQLQHNNEMIYGKFKQRALNPDGQTTGSYDENPMIISIIYEVEFEDGHVKEYTANTIAENILTQVDSYGFTLATMEEIIE